MDLFDFSWMVGRSVEFIHLNEPSQWIFSLGAGTTISAECPWRLLYQGRVTISSVDHLQRYGLPAPVDVAVEVNRLLGTVVVTSVNVREGTADLILDFGEDLRLEILPISSAYESWSVITPSGFQVIAQGGGELAGC